MMLPVSDGVNVLGSPIRREFRQGDWSFWVRRQDFVAHVHSNYRGLVWTNFPLRLLVCLTSGCYTVTCQWQCSQTKFVFAMCVAAFLLRSRFDAGCPKSSYTSAAAKSGPMESSGQYIRWHKYVVRAMSH